VGERAMPIGTYRYIQQPIFWCTAPPLAPRPLEVRSLPTRKRAIEALALLIDDVPDMLTDAVRVLYDQASASGPSLPGRRTILRIPAYPDS